MLRCDGDFLCFVVFLVFGICWGFVFFCFFSWEVNLCLLGLCFCVGRSSSLFKIPSVQRGRSACLF